MDGPPNRKIKFKIKFFNLVGGQANVTGWNMKLPSDPLDAGTKYSFVPGNRNVDNLHNGKEASQSGPMKCTESSPKMGYVVKLSCGMC